MKKVLVNYADSKFKSRQKWNSVFAKFLGRVDDVHNYCNEDIDENFKEKYRDIFSHDRGGGYWLWKPYILKKSLDKISFGDYLLYFDSGSLLVRNADMLIDNLEDSKQDVMTFSLTLLEKQWTKRDTFVIMDCDYPQFTNTNQRMGTFFVMKKTKRSAVFIEEFLKYATDDRCITDFENKCGKKNYPEFIDHRHDQSILSLLSKKHGYRSFEDISDRAKYTKHSSNSKYVSLESDGIKINKTFVFSNKKQHPIIYILKMIIKITIAKTFPKFFNKFIY